MSDLVIVVICATVLLVTLIVCATVLAVKSRDRD